MRKFTITILALAAVSLATPQAKAGCAEYLIKKYRLLTFAKPVDSTAGIEELTGIVWNRSSDGYTGQTASAWGVAKIDVSPDNLRIGVPHPIAGDLRIHLSLMDLIQRETGPLEASPNILVVERHPYQTPIQAGWYIAIERGQDSPSEFEARTRRLLRLMFQRLPREILRRHNSPGT